MPYVKPSTSGRDCVVETKVTYPDGTQERFKHRVVNAKGDVQSYYLNGITFRQCVRDGLMSKFSKVRPEL